MSTFDAKLPKTVIYSGNTLDGSRTQCCKIHATMKSDQHTTVPYMVIMILHEVQDRQPDDA